MEYELINVHEVLAGFRAGSKKDVLAHRPHTTLLMTEVAQQWLFTVSTCRYSLQLHRFQLLMYIFASLLFPSIVV